MSHDGQAQQQQSQSASDAAQPFDPMNQIMGAIDGKPFTRMEMMFGSIFGGGQKYKDAIAKNENNQKSFREESQLSVNAQYLRDGSLNLKKDTGLPTPPVDGSIKTKPINPIAPEDVGKLGSDERDFLGV